MCISYTVWYSNEVTLHIVLMTHDCSNLCISLFAQISFKFQYVRYFGVSKFASIEAKLGWNPVSRLFAPAYGANAMRNVIMCNTSFILTPITYKLYYPQEKKSNSSLFWFGMGMNFAGNTLAITQQALWGRGLDYAAVNGGRNISYIEVIKSSLQTDGRAAFFTLSKWSSRILMNAPVQGSLPWFYNNVLPLGESTVVNATKWVMTPSTPTSSSGRPNDYQPGSSNSCSRAICETR